MNCWHACICDLRLLKGIAMYSPGQILLLVNASNASAMLSEYLTKRTSYTGTSSVCPCLCLRSSPLQIETKLLKKQIF